MKRKGFPLLPILLILVGAAMLLDRTRVLTFGWWTILWALIAILGLYKMSRAFQFPVEGGMVWGTTLFFVGLYTVLEDFGVAVLPGGTQFPALLAVVGFGFLLALLRQPREWHLAIPAAVLLGIGAVMIMGEMQYLGHWVVLDTVRQWWPAALVLFGVALILNRGVAGKSSPQ